MATQDVHRGGVPGAAGALLWICPDMGLKAAWGQPPPCRACTLTRLTPCPPPLPSGANPPDSRSCHMTHLHHLPPP